MHKLNFEYSLFVSDTEIAGYRTEGHETAGTTSRLT